MATDGAGNAYVTGTTTYTAFPTTPGTWQRTLGAQGSAFIVKLDGAGTIVYSTLFGGPAGNPYPAAIAVNHAGEAFVTGGNGGALPVSEGALALKGTGAFIVRLSAAGDRMIYSAVGVGGYGIVVDANNNAYVVAGSYDASTVPISGNAIQKTVPFTVCSGNRAFVFPCSHQNVAGINAAGTQILFCTFLSGADGEGPSSIAIDANGDLYLAGTTNSTDYPVTSNALQPRNLAGVPPPPVYHEFFFQGLYAVYPTTGYLTKLAGDGSRILYSTYLGGSRNDAAVQVSVDAGGQAVVAMRLQSPDFPALPNLPIRCLPDRLHDTPALVRFNANLDAIRSTTVISGVAPGASEFVAFDAQGGAVLAGGGPYLARAGVDAAASEPLVCMTDQADYVQTASLAPGQFLTLFGAGLAGDPPAAYDPAAGELPRELGGAAVLVNGVAAPMLYASPEQINFIAPYEIAGQPTASIELITSSGEHVRRTLPVKPMSPALITLGDSSYPSCQGQTVEGSTAAVVLNPDGSRNSCANPATLGSVVSVFLTGAGAVPSAATGIVDSAGLPLNAPVSDGYGNQVVRAFAVDWAPLGVWQVDVKLTQHFVQTLPVTIAAGIQLVVNGAPVREGVAAVWLRP